MEWEVLEKVGKGRTGWTQLQSQDEQDFYAMNETGVLEFPLSESVKEAEEGFWMRGRFIVEGEGQLENLPSLPPIANIMLNTVNGINLNTSYRRYRAGVFRINKSIASCHCFCMSTQGLSVWSARKVR